MTATSDPLGRIGFAMAQRPRRVLVAHALLLLACAPLAIDVFPHLKGGGFEDDDAESWRVRAALIDELHQGNADIVVLYTSERDGGNVDEPEALGELLTIIERLERDARVQSVSSHLTTGAQQLVSVDRKSAALVVTLRGSEHDKQTALPQLRALVHADAAASGLRTHLTGFVPINEAVAAMIIDDVVRAELIALPLALLLLLWVFGSVVAAAVPVVVGVAANLLAFGGLRILCGVVDVSIFAANIVTLLSLGLAIDSTLFIVTRFREELARAPDDVDGCITRTMATTGRAVFFSGVVVALSMLGLLAMPQMLLKSLGIAGVIVVVATLTVVLSLLPALLKLCGKRINAGRIPFSARPESLADAVERKPFYRIAMRAMRWPALVAIALTAALLLAAAPFRRMEPSIPDYRVLPPGNEVREATDAFNRELLPNQLTPHDVLLRFDGAGAGADAAFTRENLAKAHAVSLQLAQLPHVEKVLSVFNAVPWLGADDVIDALASGKHRELDVISQSALAQMINGRVVRLLVLSDASFNGAIAKRQVREIRATAAPPGVRIEVGGAAAALVDLLERISARGYGMLAFVALSMFLVLAIAFRSLVVPLKAIVMNTLSMTASFGALVWIFQDGRLEGLLDYESVGFIDATQPLFMFCLVFGLSMDYEVLLIARVREEVARGVDGERAVAVALAHTGRVITSAALILCIVVGAFSLSHILSIKQLGVGIALAVILDATVVRALLVPATMKLLGRFNWWPSALSKR